MTGRRIWRLIEPVGQRSRWERCGLHPSGLARLGVSRHCRWESATTPHWRLRGGSDLLGHSSPERVRHRILVSYCGPTNFGSGWPDAHRLRGPAVSYGLGNRVPRVGADAWALAAARFPARHAATRHFGLRETASGRVRLVDVASVEAYIAALRWTGAWCVVSPSVAWTPVGFTAPLQGAGSACASPAGPHGWRQHDGRLEGRRDVLVAVGGRDGEYCSTRRSAGAITPSRSRWRRNSRCERGPASSTRCGITHEGPSSPRTGSMRAGC